MSKAPWFKLWAADFLSDNYVDAMTAEQIGWYCILLIRSWNATPKGYLANDKQLLSNWCKFASPLAFEHEARIVLDRFQTTPDGLYIYHPKLIAQLKEVVEVSEKRAVAGRKGGIAKAVAIAKQLPENRVANATHSDTDSDTDKTYIPENADELIFKIAKAYPKLSTINNETEIPKVVVDKILDAIGKDGAEKVLAGTKGYAKSLEHPKYAVKPIDFFSPPYQYREFIPQPKKRVLNPAEITERQLRGIYD